MEADAAEAVARWSKRTPHLAAMSGQLQTSAPTSSSCSPGASIFCRMLRPATARLESSATRWARRVHWVGAAAAAFPRKSNQSFLDCCAVGVPFSDGLEAFCLGGSGFFGFRASRLPRCCPLAMSSFPWIRACLDPGADDRRPRKWQERTSATYGCWVAKLRMRRLLRVGSRLASDSDARRRPGKAHMWGTAHERLRVRAGA